MITALGEAAANSGHVAARPTGLILEVRSRGGIVKLSGEKSTPWQPNLIDACADDWMAGPLENVLKALEVARAG